MAPVNDLPPEKLSMARDNLSRRLAEREPKPSTRSLMPVALVLFPLLLFLLGVVAFTGQAGLLMLAAVAAVPAFILLHYFLWGRWLLKSLRKQTSEGDSGKAGE